MKEEKFIIRVKNEILGNSERVMTIKELESFNIVALQCAQIARHHKGEYSRGMWSAELVK